MKLELQQVISIVSDVVDPMQVLPFSPDEIVYETLPGWGELSDISSESDLPSEARRFVDRVEEKAGRRVRYLSFSPDRGDLIDRGV